MKMKFHCNQKINKAVQPAQEHADFRAVQCDNKYKDSKVRDK